MRQVLASWHSFFRMVFTAETRDAHVRGPARATLRFFPSLNAILSWRLFVAAQPPPCLGGRSFATRSLCSQLALACPFCYLRRDWYSALRDHRPRTYVHTIALVFVVPTHHHHHRPERDVAGQVDGGDGGRKADGAVRAHVPHDGGRGSAIDGQARHLPEAVLGEIG